MAEEAVVTPVAEQQETMPQPTRRAFLTRTGQTGLALLLAGLPRGWVGPVYASDAPETPKVRIGIIALTDCSSLVMAYELGLFKKYGIEATISKEASWAVIRDRLTLGENQASHLLLGIGYASTMGLLGSPVKPMIMPCYLNRNGQAITLKKELLTKGVKTPETLKPQVEAAKQAGTPLTFAMTFPPGTHAMWTRYWLGAGGINPDKDVTLITIPPPQMVANMKVDKMDGFCVGEPWNYRAIVDKIGFTAVTTQQMWRDHPEKVCAFTEEFASKNPKTVKAILKALHLSSVYIDKMENRKQVADVVGQTTYINCPPEVILPRLLGQYDYGDGKIEQDPNCMIFNQRDANYPLKTFGYWWLSQFRRWGMVPSAPDYAGVVKKVIRQDIYLDAMKDMGITPKAQDMQPVKIADAMFNPNEAERY